MRICIAVLVVCLLSSTAQADENWPDFRGPTQQGHAVADHLPLTWSETENIAWKTPIPGRGWSSPVIWDEQIWITSALEEGHQLYAICVDRNTGEIVHNILVFENNETVFVHALNSHASPSAVIEEGRVYVHFGTYGTACLDTETGEKIWERRDLVIDHYRGPGSSPVLYEDLLICHYDGADLQFITAFDKRTGNTVWRIDRSFDYTGLDPDVCKGYITPTVVEHNGEPVMISPGAKAAMAYDPRTGDELWQVNYDGFSNVSRPVVRDGVVVINTGFPRAQMWAVDLDARGDANDTGVLWRYRRAVPEKPSAVLVDDLLYMVDDTGVAVCLDVADGTEVWVERLGGNFSASPLYAAGRIYFFSHEGVATVIEPGREFRLLAENELDDGFMSSVAVVGEALYLRTRTHLYRIEE